MYESIHSGMVIALDFREFHDSSSCEVRVLQEETETRYNYSWSFLLALLAFLGCEVSALLAFTAFREQFPCQQDFLMIIPGKRAAGCGLTAAAGMERKMAVVLRGQAGGAAESDTAPVDLLRGSFQKG